MRETNKVTANLTLNYSNNRPVLALRRHAIACFVKDAESAAIIAKLDLPAKSIELRIFQGGLASLDALIENTSGASVAIVQIEAQDTAQCKIFELLARNPNLRVPLIATSTGLGLTETRKLMHLGAADVLPFPFTQADIDLALAHCAQYRQATASENTTTGKVIAVLNATGGAGATTIATQMACFLADAKINPRSKQSGNVCLMDLDIQFGDVASQLNLHPSLNLGDLLESTSHIDNLYFRSVAARHKTGIDLLAAPRDMLPLDAMDNDKINHFLSMARQEYDMTVLDMPSAWSSWSLTALSQCDIIVLVLQETVSAVKHARRCLDFLTTQYIVDVKIMTVLNRHSKSWFKSLPTTDVEKALGRSIDATVSNDYEVVSAAIDQGVTLAESYSKSRVSKDIRHLAMLVVEDLNAIKIETDVASKMIF
jgi:pilus assembly protein CpaE